MIPPSLHASLLARLDRLTATREVAQIGAALGRRFSHELISAVARMPQSQIDDALAQLVSAELIFRRGTPPNAEYTFKHALVQEAAYSTLLRGQHQQVHGRIVKALESQFPETVGAQPQLMAQHCADAGRINAAISYWITAGRMSFTRSAMVEAALQLRKEFALLSSLVEGPERWCLELDLQTTLGWVEFYSKGEGAPEAGEAFVRARALCERLRDRSSLGHVLYVQGSQNIARAEYAAALEVAEDLLRVALERNDNSLEVCAHLIAGRSSYWLGAFSSAVDHFERVLSVPVLVTNDRSFRIAPPGSGQTMALAYLALSLRLLGHLDRAVACRDQAVGMAREAVDSLRGAQRAAVECLAELTVLARHQGFPFFITLAELGLAGHLSARGKTTEGLARARQAVADRTTTPRSGGRTERLAALA